MLYSERGRAQTSSDAVCCRFEKPLIYARDGKQHHSNKKPLHDVSKQQVELKIMHTTVMSDL